MLKHLTTRRWLAACGLLAGTVGSATVGATPMTIDLTTGAGWTLRYDDVAAQVSRQGPAFVYDCLGNASGPQCLSITSNGYANGTWLPDATPEGFGGRWTAFVDFTLPAGATHSKLVYEMLGFDDVANLVLAVNGNGYFVAQGEPGSPPPAGTLDLLGVGFGGFGEPGNYRLWLEVQNNPSWPDGGAVPIAGSDGTSVVGRFSVTFDLPGDTAPVPAPGTLASAGVALALLTGVRRRRGRQM